MKALTIKQPWAQLIVEGIKDIENRTWKTNYRGRIYIHAAGKSAEFVDLLDAPKEIYLHSASLRDNHEIFKTYPHGAILGDVDIIDCIQSSISKWALPNNWNWVLANPVKYKEPILNVKGALSFWQPDLSIIKD
jgi:ASCH domain-containing protein